MKRLKGPELKLPELKVPPFLSDLYWDLRDRRLLPLVALVVVGIAAVPFLLGGKSDQGSSAGTQTMLPPIASAAGSGGSTLVTVEAKPGLRNYHKRLGHRNPTDPFQQRYTAPQTAGAQLGGASTSSTTTSTSTSTTTSTAKTTDGTTTEETTESSGGAGPPPPSLKEYTIAIDVKITQTSTKANGKKESESTVHHRVIPPAALPSEKAQAVVYMGISPKTKQPLLLISDGVTSIFGDGKCLSGAEACQLLEVEPGFPETFVFGPHSTRYKITVLNPRPVVVGNYER